MTFLASSRLTGAAALALVALTVPALAQSKAEQPVPAATRAIMIAKNMAPTAPILVRLYKKESVLEVWKETRGGAYRLLKSFPICRWSGQLGPKRKEGDRQAPEGFYTVDARQMNPNSSYYLSFDIGYPNAYDRAHGGTGSYLMVHGACSSSGCYAMTDAQMGEIYALVRDALASGQQSFQFQAYPFRMTAENMARHRSDPNIAFWRQLKEGYDAFEATHRPPEVSVVGGRYAFSTGTPNGDTLVAKKRAEENARIASLIDGGIAGVRTTYADGGQNAIFAALRRKGANIGEVSRPEALAYAGREVVIEPARKPAVVAALPETPPLPPVRNAAGAADEDIKLIAGASPVLGLQFAPWSQTSPGPQFSDFSMKLALRR